MAPSVAAADSAASQGQPIPDSQTVQPQSTVGPGGQVVAWGDNSYHQIAVPTGLSGVVALSTGPGNNSLALKSDGTVVGWGDTSYTQAIPALANVVAVAAGSSFSMALKANGTVTAWGSAPAATVPPGLTGITAIAAGFRHALALKADGSVAAWGFDDYSDTIIPYAALTDVVAIAAGPFISMALKADGTVLEWGRHDYGQNLIPAGLSGVKQIVTDGGMCVALKSDGTLVSWGTLGTPPPAGLSHVAQVSYEGGNGYALKDDGTVVHWGMNQVGEGNVPVGLEGVIAMSPGWHFSLALLAPKIEGSVGAWGRDVEHQSDVPPVLGPIKALSAGRYHSLALGADGRVIAWGQNVPGIESVPLNARSGVVGVAAGGDFSLALKSDGSVVAWGSNSMGQTNLPIGVGSGIKAIAAGYEHGLALSTSGAVYAWGRNGNGQANVPATAMSGVVAIAAGGYYSAALKADGSVVAWGDSSAGQTTTGTLAGIKSISTGWNFGLALRSDGQVLGWGSDAAHQIDIPGLSNVRAVAAGALFSTALLAGGTVSAWGTNTDGDTSVPIGLSGVTMLSAGNYHVLAMAPPSALDVSGVLGPVLAGTARSLVVNAAWPSGALDPWYRGTVRFYSSDLALALPLDHLYTIADGGSHTFTIVFKTAGTQWVTAIDLSDSALRGSQTGIVVTPAAAVALRVAGFPSPTAKGSAHNFTVTAKDSYGNTASGYLGTLHFSSTDPAAMLPGAHAFTVADAGSHTFSATLKTPGTQSISAVDAVHSSIKGSQIGISVLAFTTSTYHPLTPVRLLDTRATAPVNGHSGKLSSGVPMTFQVSGRGGVPAGASAVTGNLTVTGSSSAWAIYLGPAPIAAPSSSTINFSAGQTIANGLTVALSAAGKLSATYMGPSGATTDLVFDVTGYYTPDTSGQTYHPIAPVRDVDTRLAKGLPAKLTAATPACFAVAGINGVPAGAKAVTGNVTVANPTSAWALYLGPLSIVSPTTSTLNFTAGQVASNNVTVALATAGKLCATYMGPAGATTDLVFDVSGYYTADASGAAFVPIAPVRLLDSRSANGLSGKFTAGTPRTFTVATRGGIPAGASAVTGNLTITDESAGWAIYLGPAPLAAPTTSSLNFVAGDVKANGVSVALSATGTLSATYLGPTGATTNLVFDATGFFFK